MQKASYIYQFEELNKEIREIAVQAILRWRQPPQLDELAAAVRQDTALGKLEW